MTHHKLLMATAILASTTITACSDMTAPRNDKLVTPSTAAPHIEVTFTKWFTTFPRMTGFTGGDVAGTFAGEVLSLNPFDNGVIVQLQARYEVTDPSGSRSFKALIEGKQNNKTGTAVLNGVITEGWLVGSHVHVTFQVITPCQFGTRNVCFQGTIRIQRG
jgi:hypothetical protein